MIKQNKIMSTGIKIIITMFLMISPLLAKDAKSIVESVCYACHGEKMELSCYGVTEITNTLSKETILEALREYKSGKRNKYGMGNVMKAQIHPLNDDELKALSKYIPTLK